MIRILVIEDEEKVAVNLRKGLTEQGYEVEVAFDGEMGLRLFKRNSFDLVLVDAILPIKNGFELCREMRVLNAHTKIIMLTALGSVEDKVDGLEAGADDYLVKPFDFRELLARIRAVANRREPYSTASVLSVANLRLDIDKKTAVRGDVKIDLTAKEYALLEFLIRNRGKVLSRAAITEKVWDLDFDPGTNVVDVYVNILRKKIDKDFEPKLIHTRVGMGYILDIDQ